MIQRLVTAMNPLKPLALALLATVWLAGCGEDEETTVDPAPNQNAVGICSG